MLRSAAAGVVTATTVLRAAPPPRGRWSRRNYRGRDVSLAGGPAVAAGALVGRLAAGGGAGDLVMTAAGAGLGLYDDLYGDSHARGLRGHARALTEGRLTTGMVKLAGLAGAAVVAHRIEGRPLRSLPVDVALVAGSANLVNLLDLRPGRALKVALAVSVLPAVVRADPAAAAVLGAAGAVLPRDLAEAVMIGDCGANALGALVGRAVAAGPGPLRLAALATVVGLTLASERVSFTTVIESTPALARLDAFGRRA